MFRLLVILFLIKIRFSANAKAEIQCWINNIDNSYHHINIPNPDITIYYDASLTVWGITDGISPSRGLWHKAELEHINVLELKAIEIGIYTYCKKKEFLHVRVMCDKVTAISYINNMGSMTSHTYNQDPLYFRPSPRNFTLPHKPSVNHQLCKKLQLIAIRVIILKKNFIYTLY